MNLKLFFAGKSLMIFLIILTLTFIHAGSFAQDAGLDASINRIRKGDIVVKAKPGAKVTIEQQSHEFWFGCALSDGIFSGYAPDETVKQYKEKFLENFNAAVTENAVKWLSMERQKGQVNYSIVDAMLNWTEENHIPLRAHNLFWGIPKFVQPWVKELSDSDLEQTLKNRAETITSRYKGRFAEMDLNNEMIHGNYYEDRLGPGITKKMAEWAKTGDPDIHLFLNDYDILTGNRLDDYMAQIRKLQKEGVPIAGIGVQGHLHGETFDRGELKRALDSLAQFHLPIRITEFNMPGQRSKFLKDRNLAMTQEEEQQKAKDIVDYYTICFAHPEVQGILMWGFWAGANWIPASSLFRRDWSPTPAAGAYHDLIFKKWWTSENGKTGADGKFSTRGFYGKYKITVDGQSRIVDLTKASGHLEVDF